MLVGTLRVVLPMPGKRLPTEEAFGLDVAPPGEVVDVGRPQVAAEVGEAQAKRAAHGMLAQAWFEARARGYVVIAGIASDELIERYRALGWASGPQARRRRSPRGARRPVARIDDPPGPSTPTDPQL